METQQHTAPFIDPWRTIAAMKGVATALEWFVTEGPGADQPMSPDAHRVLHGLAYAAVHFADRMNRYMEALDAAGIELPRTQAELDRVREIPGLYRVK